MLNQQQTTRNNFRYSPINITLMAVIPAMDIKGDSEAEEDNSPQQFGIRIHNEFVSYFDEDVPKEFQGYTLNEEQSKNLVIHLVKKYLFNDIKQHKVISKLLSTAYRMRGSIHVGSHKVSTLDADVAASFEDKMHENMEWEEGVSYPFDRNNKVTQNGSK